MVRTLYYTISVVLFDSKVPFVVLSHAILLFNVMYISPRYSIRFPADLYGSQVVIYGSSCPIGPI